jgi:hypothetical protein
MLMFSGEKITSLVNRVETALLIKQSDTALSHLNLVYILATCSNKIQFNYTLQFPSLFFSCLLFKNLPSDFHAI